MPAAARRRDVAVQRLYEEARRLTVFLDVAVQHRNKESGSGEVNRPRHLKAASRALRVLAWVGLTIGVLAGLGLFIGLSVMARTPSAPWLGAAIGLASVLSGAVWFAVLYGTAEGIALLLEIEARVAARDRERWDSSGR